MLGKVQSSKRLSLKLLHKQILNLGVTISRLSLTAVIPSIMATNLVHALMLSTLVLSCSYSVSAYPARQFEKDDFSELIDRLVNYERRSEHLSPLKTRNADESTATSGDAAGEASQLEEAESYLTRFGYLPKPDSCIKEALKKFQMYAGLKPTGVLDEDTINMMHKPRCGVPDTEAGVEEMDHVQPMSIGPYQSYQRPKWNKNDLTYTITNYPTELDYPNRDYDVNATKNDVVDQIVADAFSYWSSVTPLTFTPKITGSVDIIIFFQV